MRSFSAHAAAVLAVALCLGPAASRIHAGPAAPSPRDLVFAFERKIGKLPEEQRTQPLREFFAGLTERELKLEAIGMLDDRYVYVVPRSLTGELLGPLIRDGDLQVRSRAAKAVAYTGSARGFGPELDELLRSNDADTRLHVLTAFGRSRDPRFVPSISRSLGDEEPSVRAAAGVALQAVLGEKAVSQLKMLLKDSSPYVRLVVVQLVPPAQAVTLLGDPDWQVRARAVWRLGNVRDSRYTSRAARRLGDKDAHVRAAAVEALGRLKARTYRDRIVRVMEHDQDIVPRRFAAIALGELGDREALPALKRALQSNDDLLRNYAEATIRLIEGEAP